jgi:hypothetical protein
MLLDTLFTTLNSIMESYIEYGYDENEEYFEYFIEIIARMWMLIDKIHMQDIANIRVYKLFATYTFYYNNCKKNICKCDVTEVCKLCHNFDKKLYKLKIEYKDKFIDEKIIATLLLKLSNKYSSIKNDEENILS